MIRQVKESLKHAAYGYCLGQPHRLSDCLILSRWRLESLFIEFGFKLVEFPYEEPGPRRHLVFNFSSGRVVSESGTKPRLFDLCKY